MVNQFGGSAGAGFGTDPASLLAYIKVKLFTLSGTTSVLVLPVTVGCYHISVRKTIGNGPTLMCDVSKGDAASPTFTIQNSTSNPGGGPGGVKLGVTWLPGQLRINKDGLAFDGQYRSIIIAN